MPGPVQWYLFWALAYVAFAWFFMFAAMPLLNTRNSLLDMPPYAVLYWLAGVWVLAGLIGHTPWWQTLFDFQADVPVSLLMPLFWVDLSILLLFYLFHHLLQKLTRRLGRRLKFMSWLYRGIRTKSRITFERTFGEFALSSFGIALLCVILQAAEQVDLHDLSLEWRKFLTPSQSELSNASFLTSSISRTGKGTLQEERQQHLSHSRAARLAAAISTAPQDDPPLVLPWSSPVFGVWLTCMCILIVHQWFERTCEVQGLWARQSRRPPHPPLEPPPTAQGSTHQAKETPTSPRSPRSPTASDDDHDSSTVVRPQDRLPMAGVDRAHSPISAEHPFASLMAFGCLLIDADACRLRVQPRTSTLSALPCGIVLHVRLVRCFPHNDGTGHVHAAKRLLWEIRHAATAW